MNYYSINEKQLKAINVLIRTVQEAINRNTFSSNEVNQIVKVTNILNQDVTM
tara:strand:+ start:231 stop:386 length:156 start_codon:yes stop_codon:yes gene_type:complete